MTFRVGSPIPQVALVLLLVTLGMPVSQADDLGMANSMGASPSPYLRLHQDDPVLWQAWNDETLALARENDRLAFASVGYFSCHWCHVMQRESFKNQDIARRLNTGYVPVKVDRELDAALDGRLMNFVQVTRGYGGWPLNVILTPEGYPLVGIVYMPPGDFDAFIGRVHEHWLQERETLRVVTREAAREMASMEQIRQAPVDDVTVGEILDHLLAASRGLADKLSGGFGNQSKFPQAAQLLALMEARRSHDESWIDDFLVITLDRMATQGLRDHLGGGFYRYTEDPEWQVPHFEKMLYDNALLAQVYLRAGQLLAREDYRQVALHTLHFVLSRMATGRGDYVASLSAVDDQDVEGGYYLWSAQEVRNSIGDVAWKAVEPAWGFDTTPILEHGHLPIQARTTGQVAESLNLNETDVRRLLEHARQTLLEVRDARVLPVDDKVVVGWNGLLLSALAEAAPHDPKLARAGARLQRRVLDAMWQDEDLPRALDAEGRPVGKAELEDFAFVARGLADWAGFSGDSEDWDRAAAVAAVGWQLFHNENGWRSSRRPVLPGSPRLKHLEDTPLPSASASLQAVTARILAQRPHDELEALSANVEWRVTRNLVDAPYVHATQILHLYEITR